jgi:hypothetical protein
MSDDGNSVGVLSAHPGLHRVVSARAVPLGTSAKITFNFTALDLCSNF